MAPGTPFGPGIRSLLAYLHTISEGAIANAFRRMGTGLEAACAAIKAKLLSARVIASDETTTRVDGVPHWQWVFVSDQAVLHEIAPSRARSVAAAVLGAPQPEVWISDRYAGQQELGRAHQVCLAHLLRDVQYAIDGGDTVGLAAYAAKAERRLDALVGVPAAPPAGQDLQRQIKAWRGKVFVFLTERRVPPTNNVSEQEIRPSVGFRKVPHGFRSEWGAKIHAGYRSVTGTARLRGGTALDAIRSLIDGKFAIA